MSDISILLVAAASTGFIHTLIGPDHYLPFIVISKARKWKLKRTLFLTFCCGLGHIASSLIIGFAGIALGYGIAQIEGVETVRGSIAGWAFFAFGLSYMVWGIFKAVKNKPHTHVHLHGGIAHTHEHAHNATHAHITEKNAKFITPWALFIIFVLGPCELLIPLVMIPAANHDTQGIIAISLLFSTVTIATMCAVVAVGYYGLKILPTGKIERYMHAIAGATILVSALAIMFFGHSHAHGHDHHHHHHHHMHHHHEHSHDHEHEHEHEHSHDHSHDHEHDHSHDHDHEHDHDHSHPHTHSHSHPHTHPHTH